jgi:ATP-binding cassette subfamily B protein
MEREAFARARRFLNYLPVAKWLALVGSVLTGLLYVALLLVLALFADLMVNRGQIPSLDHVPIREKERFLEQITLPEEPGERKTLVEDWQKKAHVLGVEDSYLVNLLHSEAPDKLAWKDQEVRHALLWYVELPGRLQNILGDAAADMVQAEIQKNFHKWTPLLGLSKNLEDMGILSLVVRQQAGTQRWVVNPLARWNAWMWQAGNTAYLQGLFLLAICLAGLRLGGMYLTDYLAARTVIEAVTRLRRAVYHHTYRLGTLAFRALGPTEAVGVSTRHLEAVHDGLLVWLTVYFREPVKFGLLLVFALVVNFWLALAFLLFAVLVWLIGGQVAAFFRKQGRAAILEAGDQLALMQESLMLMRLVKVYLMEQFNQTRVERQLAGYARALIQRYRGEALYRPLFLFLGLLASVVLLFVAGLVVLHGQLGATSTMIMVAALVSLYWPSVRWLECRRLIRRCRESAAVVFEFLDRPGSVGQIIEAEFLPALARQLEFDNVNLREPGTDRKLLHNVSLTIRAGSRVALVGPEEMEKHALVYLLPRFLDPTSGEIRIDRKNVRWVTLDSLRAQIAMVLQHNLVFNDTVANNIGCGDPSYTLPKIIEAAKVAHVHHFIQKLPKGYETPIGEMGHALRIGEQFRIALARAILRDPALLIIEEPGVPLDEDTKGLLDDTYTRVLPGRTVIFLPHRLSTIRGCDTIFMLYQGRIEASGDHRELLAQSELYRHLQYLEFNEFAGLLQGLPTEVEETT